MKSVGASRSAAKGHAEPTPAQSAPAPRQPAPRSPVGALHAAVGNFAVGRWVAALHGAADPDLAARTLSRPGQPLEPGLRREMEGTFGQNFAGVRVHDDAMADRSARAERASAYTVGDNIVFGAGRPSQATPSGRILVAHELAHVIQQRRGGWGPAAGVEEGADSAAHDVAMGRRPRVRGAGGPRLARAPDDPEHKAKYTEWGQAYHTLGKLEEQAYHRVNEMHDEVAGRKAAQRQKSAAKSGKPAQDRDDLTYNVQYSVVDGKLVTYVSGAGGRREGVRLKPGEVWVTAKGGNTKEERHAERNTMRAPGEHITGVASRPHCETCTPAMAKAGISTGGERKHFGATHGESKPEIEAKRADMLKQPHEVGPALERILKIKDSPPPQADPEVSRRHPPGQSVTGSGHPAPAAGAPVTAPATNTAHGAPGAGAPHVSPGTGSAHPAGGPGAGPAASISSAAHPSPGAQDAHPAPGAGVPHGPLAAGTTGTSPTATGIRPPAAQSRAEDHPPRRERGEQIAPGVFKRRKAGSDQGDGGGHPGSASAGSVDDASWSKFLDFAKSLDPPRKKRAPRREGDKAQSRKEGADPKTRAPAKTGKRAPTTAPSGEGARRKAARTPARAPATTPAGADAHPATAQAHAPAAPASTAHPPAPALHDQAPPAHAAPPPAHAGSPSTRPGTSAATSGPPPAHAAPPVQHAPPATHAGAESGAAPPPARKPPSPPLPRIPLTGTKTPPGGTSGGSGGGAGGMGAHSTGHPPPTAGAPRPTTTQGAAPASGAAGPPAKSTTRPDPAKPATKPSASRAHTEKERAGDVAAAKSKTTALSRDQGRLGIGSTTSRRSGQEDERGNLDRGHEGSRSRSGGLVAGPGGVGGFGSAGASATQAHGRGLKTTQSIGADGQATVDVKPVPGTNPVQYRMTVVLSLGGHVSAGGGLERGRMGASASVSAQGSVTGVFEHTFSSEQVDAYLGALKDPSAGGAEKEFRIMRLAIGGSLQEAKSMLAVVGSAGLSPAALAHMKEGDSSEVTVQGGAELQGGLSGQGQVFGFSLGGSLSRSGSLRRHVTIKDGKALVTVEVLSGKGASGGAAVSVYGVEAGAGYGELESTGESVTFSANPTDATSLGQIAAVDSAAALRSLAAAPGGAEVVSRTQSKEKTTTTTVKGGFLGAEAEIGVVHTYGERTITGPDGVTKEYTGGSGGRVAAGLKDGPKVSYGEKDTVALAGGPDNQGYGDVSTTTTQTDVDKSARDAKKAPVRTALGLATGGTPALAEGEEVVGMKLSDADFNRLSAAASDNKAWTDAFLDSGSHVNQSHADALRLAARIRAAQGDRKAIAQAFAQYAKDNDNAAKFVQEIVRPRGETEGGRRYDWPAEYAGEQSVYESLVLGDPGVEADRLATSGNVEGAVQSLQNAVTQLDTVATTVNDNRNRFSDQAAVAEMLRSMRRRQHDLNKKVSELQTPAQPEAVKADPANADPANADPAKADGPPEGAGSAAAPAAEAKAAPDPVRIGQATADIFRYIADCQQNRANEQAKFAQIDSEYDHWYRNADPNTIFEILNELRDHVYPLWDKQIEDMKGFYKDLGQDPNQALQYGPDRAGWKQRRNNPEMTKWG